jgi:glycosyltransferase involved in cell wall biosynthesis
MMIAFDVSYVQKRRAGLGRYATELLRALLAADSENSYKLHGWSYSIDDDWLVQLRSTTVELHIAKVPGFIKRYYWNHLHFPPIETIIGEFDIFQSIDPFLPPTRKKKTVASVHDLSYRKFPQFFERSILRWDKHVSLSIYASSAIVVPSLQTKCDVLEMFQIPDEKITLVRPPVNPIFTPHADETFDGDVKGKYRLNHPFILFVGTLEPRKNILTLISAFETLHREKKMDLELIIAGKRGWLYRKILEAMMRSPVREKIRHLDYVTDKELACLYRAAEFFVYPSYYEGHGSPVVEAMASGKAVITSNTSSLREIGDGTALLVNPNSAEELTQAMRILLEDPSQRAALSQRSLQKARVFSGPAAAANLLALYHSLR